MLFPLNFWQKLVFSWVTHFKMQILSMQDPLDKEEEWLTPHPSYLEMNIFSPPPTLSSWAFFEENALMSRMCCWKGGAAEVIHQQVLYCHVMILNLSFFLCFLLFFESKNTWRIAKNHIMTWKMKEKHTSPSSRDDNDYKGWVIR